MNNDSVIAIIVSFNPDINVLATNVESLKKQVDKVIVVDNFSINNEELVAQLSREVEILSLDKNYGLAKAQNDGIREAKKMGATHVIIFDQDSIVDDNFVSEQLKGEKFLISEGFDVGAIGPSFYDRNSGYVYPATKYRGPFLDKIPLKDTPNEVTFIIASGALIRLEVLDKVGLMREDFFIDFVDVEWSIRAKSMGFSSYMNPNVKMQHNIGDERVEIFGRLISLHSDFRKYYIVRNAIFISRLGFVPIDIR